MTTVVMDSAAEIELLTTGTMQPAPEVAADNAQRASKDAAPSKENAAQTAVNDKPQSRLDNKKAAAIAASDEELAALDDQNDPDNIADEEGLTPRQRRIFTKAMQKTISRKHYAQREAERLATESYNREQLAADRSRVQEERAARLEAELARIREANKPAPKAAETAPDRAAFETDEAYQDALIEFKVEQRLQKQREADAKRAEEARQAEILGHAKARIERARELVPDFDAITRAANFEVPSHISTYMQESDLFAELGYHFAKNPDSLASLAKHTAGKDPRTREYVTGITKSLVELGKIEAKLTPFSKEKPPNGEAPKETTPKGEELTSTTGTAPTSKPRVPAPVIRPLTASSATQVEKDPEGRSTSEEIAAWERRHGAKLTARKRH